MSDLKGLKRTEARLAEESREGAEVGRLLDNDLLKGAFDKIEEACLQAWKETDEHDAEGREHIYRHYKATVRARGVLEDVVRTGKLAQAELDKIVRPKIKRIKEKAAS